MQPSNGKDAEMIAHIIERVERMEGDSAFEKRKRKFIMKLCTCTTMKQLFSFRTFTPAWHLGVDLREYVAMSMLVRRTEGDFEERWWVEKPAEGVPPGTPAKHYAVYKVGDLVDISSIMVMGDPRELHKRLYPYLSSTKKVSEAEHYGFDRFYPLTQKDMAEFNITIEEARHFHPIVKGKLRNQAHMRGKTALFYAPVFLPAHHLAAQEAWDNAVVLNDSMSTMLQMEAGLSVPGGTAALTFNSVPPTTQQIPPQVSATMTTPPALTMPTPAFMQFPTQTTPDTFLYDYIADPLVVQHQIYEPPRSAAPADIFGSVGGHQNGMVQAEFLVEPSDGTFYGHPRRSERMKRKPDVQKGRRSSFANYADSDDDSDGEWQADSMEVDH